MLKDVGGSDDEDDVFDELNHSAAELCEVFTVFEDSLHVRFDLAKFRAIEYLIRKTRQLFGVSIALS